MTSCNTFNDISIYIYIVSLYVTHDYINGGDRHEKDVSLKRGITARK